jgi:Acetyltransferase (GNAT) domain
MRRLLIRHFEHSDIESRAELLAERDFTRNLANLGVLTSRDELRRAQARTIEEEYESKIIFVVTTPAEAIVGYTWITNIDWLNRTCELSIALLPRFRRSYGLLALIEMYDYLYDEMNFETVINQVLVGNEMLMSDGAAERTRQVYCDNDSFTDGAFRDSRYWTQSRQEHRAFAQRARERNARIRERLQRASRELTRA